MNNTAIVARYYNMYVEMYIRMEIFCGFRIHDSC